MEIMRVRFFWFGEESEIFCATSIQQLFDDKGNCGTGIHRVIDGKPVEYDGEAIEYGELDPDARTTIIEIDEDERPIGQFTGTLSEIYGRTIAGKYELPVMLMTQYN
ncbi:hypothetical protein [Burkholderia gladioli]|uniref:hypothetical protein n=1 Tax=Burkholderia gladioli TaxID=28095 RepID=UPI0016406E7A|nr:hypothetical protein [Burkholderia gladioli]